MFGRIILVFCIQAVILQSVWSQCTNRVGVPTSPGLAIPYGAGLTASSFASPAYIAPVGVNPCANSALSAPAIEVAPTSGGSLPVTSASAVPPDNIVLTSENVYEGTLNVAGELPFVGTVGLDGVLPSVGTGAVSHSCGGPARITSANLGPVISNSAIIPNIYGSSLGLAGLAGITGTEAGQIGGYPGVGYSGIGCAGIPSSYPGSGYSGIGCAGISSSYPGSGYSGIGCAGIPSSYPGSGLSVGVPYTGLVETGIVREAIRTGILPGDVGYYGGLGSRVVTGLGGYGGDGEGNIAVIGDLPTAGETVVVGQVPIDGIVGFRGPVPAYGTVSISGFCSCGCDIPYL